MRTWLRAIVTTPTAISDFEDHLTKLIEEEDKLSKADNIEKLHYQRGKVDGLKSVLFALHNAKREKR